MYSVSDAFSVEEADLMRRISHSAQVSWKKDLLPSITFFTIGVSAIGGNDIIAGQAGVSDFSKYVYEDESDYITYMGWERELNEPIGGLTKALAEFKVDNTSGRYTPRYAGGTSAIFTSVSDPRRPVNLQAGFHYDGIDHNIPQFVGLTTKPPVIDTRSRTASFQAEDFIGYLQNQYVDTDAMFTSIRTDQAIEQFLINSGFSTSQYDLDEGISVIPFALFEKGTKAGKYLNQLVQSENGRMYQDEEGIIRFQNRQAWDVFPYFNVQRIISTSQVLEARTPDTSHIINVVEVKGKVRAKQPEQIIFKGATGDGIPIQGSLTKEVFVNFQDPVLSMTTPTNGNTASYFRANSSIDGTGTDLTSSVTVQRVSRFARAAKIIFSNASATDAYITELVITGRPAQLLKEIYYRDKRGISVTAFEEQPYLVENDYIQDASWANSYAQLILNDYSQPEYMQELVIRAIPELQFGDLISWQGEHWRVFGINTKLDPNAGFIQTLKLLQRGDEGASSYFRIGISVIGGMDRIAA